MYVKKPHNNIDKLTIFCLIAITYYVQLLTFIFTASSAIFILIIFN